MLIEWPPPSRHYLFQMSVTNLLSHCRELWVVFADQGFEHSRGNAVLTLHVTIVGNNRRCVSAAQETIGHLGQLALQTLARILAAGLQVVNINWVVPRHKCWKIKYRLEHRGHVAATMLRARCRLANERRTILQIATMRETYLLPRFLKPV